MDRGLRQLVAVGDLFVVATVVMMFLIADSTERRNATVTKWLVGFNILFIAGRATFLLASTRRHHSRLSLGLTDRPTGTTKETP